MIAHKSLRIIVLLVMASLSTLNAAYKTKAICAYVNRYDVVKSYTLSVDFISGYELSQKTYDFSYDVIAMYAVLWFGNGEAAIVKIEEVPAVAGEITASSFEYLTVYAQINDVLNPYFSGYDKSGTYWHIYI